MAIDPPGENVFSRFNLRKQQPVVACMHSGGAGVVLESNLLASLKIGNGNLLDTQGFAKRQTVLVAVRVVSHTPRDMST